MTTSTLTATDGTVIGYRQIGHGPGMIVLHGMMESATSHLQLAESLADSFTVFLPDRRGRGLSGPFSPHHDVQKDVDDVDALLRVTGAHHVFAVSAGAIVGLEAARSLPAIRKLAIYEPPLSLTRSQASAILKRFDAEMAQGRVAAALVTAMKGAQMGPPIFNVLPRRLLELLTTRAMAYDEKTSSGDHVTMRMLAPTLHDDIRLVVETSENLERFTDVHTDVLLLGGSKSPAYLKDALDTLENIIPGARRIEFAGLGHGGSGNSDRGGRPEQVAHALRRHFA